VATRQTSPNPCGESRCDSGDHFATNRAKVRHEFEGRLLADERFFRRNGPIPLGEIALHVGGELSAEAPAAFLIQDVAALDCAESGELSVFSDSKRSSEFATCRASVIVTSRKLGAHDHNGSWLLLVQDPRLAFTQIGHLFYPAYQPEAGIHQGAQIDATASIGAGSQIRCGAVIGRDARLGAGCVVDCNAVIGDGVILGENCRIGANTTISHAVIGSRVQISSNVSIGGEGFGFVPGPKGLLHVAHFGRVVIENDVRIGGNCAIDRGAMDDTFIGAGTVIDNLVQIAHNVRIGRYCVIAGQVGIAGSSTLGDQVMIGGQVGINDHLTIGSRARIAAKSGVIHNVAEGETVGGYPAVPIRQWHRQTIEATARHATRKPD
jgi:UDP-3-O-[3-hydroxymyristoyl] glucosamine N-acyltransferase